MFPYAYRHGQSIYNDVSRIGGDSGLSVHGVNYAKAVAKFVNEKVCLLVCLLYIAMHICYIVLCCVVNR